MIRVVQNLIRAAALWDLFRGFETPAPLEQAELREARKTGHELRDVSSRGLFYAAIFIVLSAIVLHLLLAVLLAFLREHLPAPRTGHPMATAATVIPPEPRLQSRPLEDLKAFREREKQILASYGWVDRSRGIARIPVERAMELVAEGKRP